VAKFLFNSSTVFLAACCLAGCNNNTPGTPTPNGQQDPPSKAMFTDRTQEYGIDFAYKNGQEHDVVAILESLGGGLALFDYDGDRVLDLFVPGGGTYRDNKPVGLAPGFFRGDGSRFEAISGVSGTAIADFYSHGVQANDYDNDGFTDLLVTGFGGLHLFHNQGDGTFAEVTVSADLKDDQWSSSAAWGDINGDGNLDLFVIHYVDWSMDNHPDCLLANEVREVCSPREFTGLRDAYFESNGDGTFTDKTDKMGIAPEGKGLGVVIADVDLDGQVEVYVGNDTVPNFLYDVVEDGTFEEVALISGTAIDDTGTANGSMGVDIADLNIDGKPDVWVANYQNESVALYRNDGNGMFKHVSSIMGINDVGGLFVGWGTSPFDFDHDGDEDVFVSNGHIMLYPEDSPIKQEPLFYENLAGKKLRNIANKAGDYMAAAHNGRGSAAGDIDDDGDIDLAVSRVNEPVAIVMNETPDQGHWIRFKLIGVNSNRDAIGAQIEITTPSGSQIRQIKGGGGYSSTSDLRAHFGISSDEKIQSVKVRWPSGTTQEFNDLAANRDWILIEDGESAL